MEANKIKRLPLPSNWRVVHPTTYVHIDDLLDETGKYLTVAVVTEKVELHEIENPRTFLKEKKLVVYFKGKEKGLILNATMNKVIQEVSGTRDPRKWGGVSLELFVDPTVKFAGKSKPAVRVRAGKGQKAAPQPRLTDEPQIVANLNDLPDEELDKLMEEAAHEVSA